MFKKSKTLLLVSLLIAVVATFVACNNDKVVTVDFTLEQTNQSGTNVQIEVGNTNFSSIIFNKVKDGKVLETVVATTDMITAEDLAKLSVVGTHTITVTYQAAQLRVTITVVPKKNTTIYTMTYNAVGGSFNDTEDPTKQESASIINAIPIPAKQGFSFGGWYFNEDYTGEKLITPFTLAQNTQVYAKWVDNRQFTVTFKNEDGTTLKVYENVEYGKMVTPPVAPDIFGKMFVKWSSEDYKNVKSTTTITAIYSQIRVEITFFNENKDIYKEVKVINYDGDLTPYVFPSKEGYTGKWIDRKTGKAPIYKNIRENMTIDAVYTINKYSINFNIPKDHTQNPKYAEFTKYDFREVEYNTPIAQLPAVPQINGYIGKWTIINADGEFVDGATELAKSFKNNLEVYAVYIRQIFTLNYIFDAQNKTFAQYYGDVIASPYIIPNAEGKPLYPEKYYTVQWFTNSTFEQSSLITFPINVVGNMTLHAKIIEKPLTVDFCVPNTDINGDPIKYHSGDKIIKTVAVRKGTSVIAPTPEFIMYNVVGWKYANGNNANLENITDFHIYNTNAAEDTAIYAVLQVKTFDVSFYNMELDGSSPQKIIYKPITAGGAYPMHNVAYDTQFTNVPLSQYVIKPSYSDGKLDNFEFDGWYTKDGVKVNFEKNVNNTIRSNSEFFARWVDKLLGTEGLQYTLYSDATYGDSYAVTGFKFNDAEINYVFSTIYIPRTYNNVAVRKIAQTAFSGAQFIKVSYLELTNNIIVIEDNALSSLKGFRGVSFVDGENALFSTAVIETDVIGDISALYNKDKTILYRFPTAETTLQSFTIPNTVVTIAGGAFALCPIKEIVCDSTLSTLNIIRESAFFGMMNLTTVTLPNSLVTIQSNAFMYCYNLSTIVIDPANSALLNVADGALNETAWWNNKVVNKNDIRLANVLVKVLDTTLSGVYTVDSGITSIADKAFAPESALNITTIRFESDSKLVNIGSNAFAACSTLANIYILTNAVPTIGDNAFAGIQYDAKMYVQTKNVDAFKLCNQISNYFKDANIIGI